jgi:hypothetical protein
MKGQTMPVPPNKRPTYDSVFGSGDDFNDLWNQTEAADDGFDPLPSGTYRCLVSDGRLSQAKSGTPSYKLTFSVLDGEHANRKIWHDLWLTPRALAMAKRDLIKLGLNRPEQLNQAPPTGIVCDVKVVVRTEDDGRSYNRVTGFAVVEGAPPAGTLDPDDDEADQRDEGDNQNYSAEVPY